MPHMVDLSSQAYSWFAKDAYERGLDSSSRGHPRIEDVPPGDPGNPQWYSRWRGYQYINDVLLSRGCVARGCSTCAGIHGRVREAVQLAYKSTEWFPENAEKEIAGEWVAEAHLASPILVGSIMAMCSRDRDAAEVALVQLHSRLPDEVLVMLMPLFSFSIRGKPINPHLEQAFLRAISNHSSGAGPIGRESFSSWFRSASARGLLPNSMILLDTAIRFNGLAVLRRQAAMFFDPSGQDWFPALQHRFSTHEDAASGILLLEGPNIDPARCAGVLDSLLNRGLAADDRLIEHLLRYILSEQQLTQEVKSALRHFALSASPFWLEQALQHLEEHFPAHVAQLTEIIRTRLTAQGDADLALHWIKAPNNRLTQFPESVAVVLDSARKADQDAPTWNRKHHNLQVLIATIAEYAPSWAKVVTEHLTDSAVDTDVSLARALLENGILPWPISDTSRARLVRKIEAHEESVKLQEEAHKRARQEKHSQRSNPARQRRIRRLKELEGLGPAVRLQAIATATDVNLAFFPSEWGDVDLGALQSVPKQTLVQLSQRCQQKSAKGWRRAGQRIRQHLKAGTHEE